MRKIIAIVAVVAICFSSFLLFSACNKQDEQVEVGGFRDANKPSVATEIDVVVPAESDTAAQKQLAYELYTQANKLDQQIDKRAYAVNHSTKMFGGAMEAKGFRYEVKNGEEYCFTDYSFTSQESGAGASLMLAMFSAVNSTRKYTNSWMDEMYIERAEGTNKEFYLVAEDDDTYWAQDGRLLQADWSKLVVGKEGQYGVEQDGKITGKYVPKPYYMASQELKYQQTEQQILPETLTYAKVTYNSEEGYYNVDFVLDAANPKTTEITIVNLRAGAPNASYMEIKGSFQIWNNGYFKEFHALDSFDTGMAGITSTLDFKTLFYYDAKSCDITNYQYMEDLANKCSAAAGRGEYVPMEYSNRNPANTAGAIITTAIIVLLVAGATVIVKRVI